MVLDYLRDVAVPVILGILGMGVWGARTVARRTEPTTPAPVAPPDAPDPDTASREDVERYLLAEVARLASAQEHLERIVEDFVPVVHWIDGGAPPPPPTISATVRRLIGLNPAGPGTGPTNDWETR